MWKCRNCQEKVDDQFEICWHCGYSKEGTPPADSNVFDEQKEEFAESESEEEDLEESEGSDDGEEDAEESGVTYDPVIIQSFARDLYSQANTIVAIYGFVGGVIGFLIGFVLLRGIDIYNNQTGQGVIGGFFGAIVLGGIGYLMGQQRAFGLKLQAQVALCQVQIEENTRQVVATSKVRKDGNKELN